MMINSFDLLCGTGGLAIELQQAGFNHKALIAWEKILAITFSLI